MANTKIKATAQLFLDTSNATADAKQFVADLRRQLSSIETAADKMTVFKDMVGYIADIDKALAALKAKDGDAFSHMFDGMDQAFLAEFEKIFSIARSKISELNSLRNLLSDPFVENTDMDTLKQWSKTIKDIYSSMGVDMKFTARKPDKMVAQMKDAVDGFAVVWDNVMSKMAKGFQFGGTGGVGEGAGGIGSFSADVQKEIDKLEQQVEHLEQLKERFQQAAKTFSKIDKKGNSAIPDSIEVDLTVEAVRSLISEFDALSAALTSGDKSSEEYFNNLLKMSDVIMKLKKTDKDLWGAGTDIKSAFQDPSGISGIGNMRDALSKYASAFSAKYTKLLSDVVNDNSIDSLIKARLSSIERIKSEASKNADSGNIDIDAGKIKNRIDELEKQLKRYEDIVKKFNAVKDVQNAMDTGDEIPDEYQTDYSVEAIEKLVDAFDKLTAARKAMEKAGDTSSDKYYDNLVEMAKVALKISDAEQNIYQDVEEALDTKRRGSGTLGAAWERVTDEANTFLGGTFESIAGSVSPIIDSIRSELSSLQEQLKSVGAGTGNRIGGANKGGAVTEIDFSSLEGTIKSEAANLASKLDSTLKVEVVKNDLSDILSAINEVKSTISEFNKANDDSEYQGQVDIMKANLTQLFDRVSQFNQRRVEDHYQQQELGAAILSDGSISTSFGEKGSVPWDRLAGSLVSNLSKSLLVDVHSHPFAQLSNGQKAANDSFSGSKGDLSAFRFSKELGAQLTAMITGNIMRVFDVSKLTDRQMKDFRTNLADIEKKYAKNPAYADYITYDEQTGKRKFIRQDTLAGQHRVSEIFESMMYDAFKSIGISKDKVDRDVFQKYNLTDDTQLTALAERLVALSTASQGAISPIDRLAEIITQFGGDVKSEKAKVELEAFNKGEKSAAAVFNALNGKGYTLNNDTLNSLLTIDSRQEASVVESLLAQISSVLNQISASVANINNNTKPSTYEDMDSAMNGIMDLRSGLGHNLTRGIEKIFDASNISKYKNADVLNLVEQEYQSFNETLKHTYMDSMENGVDIADVQTLLNKFTTALSHTQDAMSQIDLYNSRTGERAQTRYGTDARDDLDETYQDLTNGTNLQALLHLLSQAKINLAKEKRFYDDGLGKGESLGDVEGGKLVAELNAINATLQSIYGVLHGFTGIESDNKNSFKYKEPAIAKTQNEFSESDISTLNSILQAIQEIGSYLHSIKDEEIPKKDIDEENNAISELASLIQSKFSQQFATEDGLQALKSVVDNLYSAISQENDASAKKEQDDEEEQKSQIYQLLSSRLPQNIATEDTLGAIKSAIEQLVALTQSNNDANKNEELKTKESLSQLVNSLSDSVKVLNNAANGIVQYQKATKSDTGAADARLKDAASVDMIRFNALNAVKGRVVEGGDSQVTDMVALANGLVKVTGYIQTAENAWEGFTLQVNEANEVSKLAYDTNAKAARDAAKAAKEMEEEKQKDTNPVIFTPEQVRQNALAYMKEVNEQHPGKEATLQYKDSGRYTVAVKETIGGLTKETFQTFDEFSENMERTTVTLSNKLATEIGNAYKFIGDNLQDIGNADALTRYLDAYNELIAMNQKYESQDSVSDEDTAIWNNQIALVRTLGSEMSGLIKQRQKLDSQQGVVVSAKKLQAYQSSIDKTLKGTGLSITSAPEDEAGKNILSKYTALTQKLNDLKKSGSVLTDGQTQEINQLVAELNQLTQAYNDNAAAAEAARKNQEEQTALRDTKANKLADMDQYKNSIKNVAVLTDDLNNSFVALKSELQGITSADGLTEWEAKFQRFKDAVAESQDKLSKSQLSDIDLKEKELKASLSGLDFKITDHDLTGEAAEIKSEYLQLMQILDEYKAKVRSGESVELSSIEQSVSALYGKIDARKKDIQAQKEAEKLQKAQEKDKVSKTLSGLSNQLNKDFKTLDFTIDSENLDDEQRVIAKRYKDLVEVIRQAQVEMKNGGQVNTSAIETETSALLKQIAAYKERNNIANARGGSANAYGLRQVQNFTGTYNSLMAGASQVGLGDDFGAVQNLANAYKRLTDAQKAFKAGEDLTSGVGAQKVAEFRAAQVECTNYANALKRLIAAEQERASKSENETPVAPGVADTSDGRREALRQYIQDFYGASAVIEKFSDDCTQATFSMRNADNTVSQMSASFNAARTSISATTDDVKQLATGWQSFTNAIGGKFKDLWAYTISRLGVDEILQAVRSGFQSVLEIDTALTELKKVTNETDSTYQAFLGTMSQTATVVGSTVSNLTTMAGEWAKLGYTLKEAGQLAESTAILLNVSEFNDATTASEALISTMQAFEYTAKDSQHVVDVLNEVGNNYAVSSDGIATALKTSASALMEAGNDLEQSTALVAAANKVVQDPSSVGSALRTISLRLRGTSVEVLQQMGEETEGAAESTSKLQAQLKALTGVDILTNAGEYKDTYTILKEIGAVWEDMGKMDQAAALELMAGKNRANTLAAILNNMEDLEGAYESALNSEGSSLEENAAYMDSIQGHIDQFNNAVQTMWMNFMNSDVLKFIIDMGTGIVNLIDKFGVLSTAIAGVLTYFSISKDSNFDLASALGIHDLEKGWSVFGKEGLTGKVAGWFDKDQRDAKKQGKAAKQKAKADIPSLQESKRIQREQEEAAKRQKQQEEAQRQQRQQTEEAQRRQRQQEEDARRLQKQKEEEAKRLQQQEANRIQREKEEAARIQRQQEADAKIAESKKVKETKPQAESKGNIFKNLFKRSKKTAEDAQKINPYDLLFPGREDHINGSYIYEIEQEIEKINAELPDLFMEDNPKYNGKDMSVLRDEATAKKAEYEKQLKYLRQKRDEYLKDGVQSGPMTSVSDSLEKGVKDVQVPAQKMGQAIQDGITNFDTSELDNKIVDVEDKIAKANDDYKHSMSRFNDMSLPEDERDRAKRYADQSLAEKRKLQGEESRLHAQRREISSAARQQGAEVPLLKDATAKIREARKQVEGPSQEVGKAIGEGISKFDTSELDNKIVDVEDKLKVAYAKQKELLDKSKDMSLSDDERAASKKSADAISRDIMDLESEQTELGIQRRNKAFEAANAGIDVPSIKEATAKIREARKQVETPAQEVGQAIEAGINNVDTSQIETKIESVSEKLEDARDDFERQDDDIVESSTTQTTDIPQVQDAVNVVEDAVEGVQAPAQDFANAVQDGMTDIDLSELDTKIQDATDKYESALKDFNDTETLARSNPYANHPDVVNAAKNALPQKTKELEEAKKQLEDLKKQRAEIAGEVPTQTDTTNVPQIQAEADAYKADAQAAADLGDAKQDLSTATPTSDVSDINAETNAYEQQKQVITDVQQAKQDAATSTPSAAPQINADTQAYQSMFDILNQIKGVKLEIGDEQYAAGMLDNIKSAASEGEGALQQYISAMGDVDAATGNSNVALKAYVASVKDGNYSMAGFQQFVQQHNMGLQSMTGATKAAAIAHQALNAVVGMGIGLLISGAINLATQAWEKYAKAAEHAAENAKDALNKYADSQKTLRDQKKTIDELGDTYEKLSKGVDKLDNSNINLSTSAYQEYLDVCNNIGDMFPELVSGFDAQGNAILSLKGNVDGLTASYEAAGRAARQELIASGEDIFNTFNNQYSHGATMLQRDVGYREELEAATALHEALQDAIDGNYEKLRKYQAKHIATATADTTKFYASKQLFENAGINDDDLFTLAGVNRNKEDLILAYERLNRRMQTLKPMLSGGLDGVKTLAEAYIGDDEEYIQLGNQTQSFIKSIISNLDADFIRGFDGNVNNFVTWLFDDLVGAFSDPRFGDILSNSMSEAFDLQNLFNRDGISIDSYKNQMLDIIEDINNLDIDSEVKDNIFSIFGLDMDKMRQGEETYGKEIESMVTYARTLFSEEASHLQDDIMSLSYSDLEIINSENFNIEPGTLLTWDELIARIREVRNITGQGVISVQTFSATHEGIASYNDLLNQTSEVVLDNTEVTQEYKDALTGLGVSAEALNECFYENNKLVVKDAKALNDLVKSAKSNTLSNIRLAKSQAGLQYYELYKEMRNLTNGQYVADEATRNKINTLYDEMTAISQTIAKYNMLEQSLLGAADAYSEIEAAREADNATDYGAQAEDLVKTLGDAFVSAELGTEAAQVAIKGLIPESVFADADTLDEKMQKIYDYFTNGEVSQLFTIEFNEEGEITGVEMTKENVENFVNTLLNKDLEGGVGKIFEGTADNFTLNPQITSLEEFAEATNLSKEAAFAFLTSLERYDISWLNGDGTSLLDQLMGDDLEYQIYNTTQQIADLEQGLATGRVTIEEYTKKMYGLAHASSLGYDVADEITNLNEQYQNGTITLAEYQRQLYGLNYASYQNGEAAREQIQNWSYQSEALKNAKDELQFYNDQLADPEVTEYKDQIGQVIDEETLKRNIDAAAGNVSRISAELAEISQPTELTFQFAIDQVQNEMDKIKTRIGNVIEGTHYQLNVETGKYEVTTEFTNNEEVQKYVDLLNEKHTLEITKGESATSTVDTLQNIAKTLENIASLLSQKFNIDVETDGALSNVRTLADEIDQVKPKTVTISARVRTFMDSAINGIRDIFGGGNDVNGTAHAQGTTGSWGAAKTETALVGELGPELRVRGSQWSLIGQNGAEFTDVKKGDIIFNHKQTQSLLKNGYVTGRGKAYAYGTSGTAYASIHPWDTGINLGNDYSNTSGSEIRNAAGKLSDAAGDVSDSADEFKEVFDWIEVRLEEINEDISLKSAKLENSVGSSKQNAIIDDMIALNQKLYDNLTAGASKYYEYAEKLLAKVPEEYRKAAQDGSIAIEAFTGEAGEKTLEAIQEYRDWVQKGADATQQAEETLTEISNLAKQAIDNIVSEYENKASMPTIKVEQLEAYNSLIETTSGYESAKIYEAMIKENNKHIQILEQQRNKMQSELNAQVDAGRIKKYSQAWYDAVNDIAAVDTEIIELTTDTEGYQDSINELHWEHFDSLISRFKAISDEAENLIDILSSEDLVDKDTGEWTDEGITSLGLYAQQMEVAEMQAAKYREEIDYLNKNWKKLGYTEKEYVEKLEELKSGQYDSIKAYNDTKKAIKDLTSERIDAIKEGIDKEIEAYEELINKKKEELDAEKDLYDFQKGVADQQKEISDIERKLAALSADNSASARAKRAQLEADLAKAREELQETYYDRSIEDQQNALDKELENFQEEKEKEKEGWDEYLENTEQIVADSLETVQTNTEIVYQTLQSMGQEYSLSIAEAITSPWEDGEVAIQNYSEQFKLSMSSTVEELQKLATEYKKVTSEIEGVGQEAVTTVAGNASRYTNDSSSTTSKTTTQTSNTSTSSASRTYTVQNGDSLWSIAQSQLGNGSRWQEIYNLNKDQISNPNVISKGQKLRLPQYAKGTKGVIENQLAWIDELGEELVLRPQNGRLSFMEKGTSVIPADLTENLMAWGELDPSVMLERNRPEIKLHPEVHNTEVNISMDIAEVVHVDRVDHDTMPDLTKAVEKQLDKYMKNLNNQIRRYVR